MLDKNLLKAERVKKGYDTNKTFCSAIGMSESTYNRRLKTGNFRTDEAERIIAALSLTKGVATKIFFA